MINFFFAIYVRLESRKKCREMEAKWIEQKYQKKFRSLWAVVVETLFLPSTLLWSAFRCFSPILSFVHEADKKRNFFRLARKSPSFVWVAYRCAFFFFVTIQKSLLNTTCETSRPWNSVSRTAITRRRSEWWGKRKQLEKRAELFRFNLSFDSKSEVISNMTLRDPSRSWEVKRSVVAW